MFIVLYWYLLALKIQPLVQKRGVWLASILRGPHSLQTLSVPSHEILFFHNKFAFGEYIHVHSVVLKVGL